MFLFVTVMILLNLQTVRESQDLILLHVHA